ncbi:MAG TPA: A24 family peptidase [Candidatus Elarobacter sp.]
MPLLAAVAGTTGAAIADLRTGRIPNTISRTTTIVALGAAAAAGFVDSAASGAVLVGGLLLALYVLTAGCGIGLGDVKLGVAIGAGCGPFGGSVALAVAFITGAAYGVWLLATRKARFGAEIRFGPFLAAGTLVAAAQAVAAG